MLNNIDLIDFEKLDEKSKLSKQIKLYNVPVMQVFY